MEKVITCPNCFNSDQCFEEVQETFSSYLCFHCGFMSDSRYEIGSLRLTENLKKSPNEVLQSLSSNYKNSYSKKIVTELKKFKNFRVIGMGGSILGTKAIYNFLEPKFKNFEFIDNFSGNTYNKKNTLNLIISKSGNTLETLSNVSVLIKKKEKNVFISENKKSYLTELANRLKAEFISHNNYIGGRYSVLSEVGMLPAQLMCFNPAKFRRLNSLIKNKRFINSLVSNVSTSRVAMPNDLLNLFSLSSIIFLLVFLLVYKNILKKGKRSSHGIKLTNHTSQLD